MGYKLSEYTHKRALYDNVKAQKHLCNQHIGLPQRNFGKSLRLIYRKDDSVLVQNVSRAHVAFARKSNVLKKKKKNIVQ